MAQFTFVPSAEAPEIADAIRALFDDLEANLRQDQRAYSGQCQPALDVLETDQAVEIVMDLSGVPKDAVRILFRAGVVIVAGEKAAPTPSGTEGNAFHLVEREFGRFARAVRLGGAFDVANGRASLEKGELTIVLPKIADRRGQSHEIRIA
jgi:HSP20 family protein